MVVATGAWEKRGDRRQRRVVAVTGGAGYIGSVLVRRLARPGAQVRVIERFLYGDGAIRDLLPHPNLSLVIADFRQPHGLDGAIAGADAVVHLGAIVGEVACALDEDFALSTNVEGTKLIANLCRAHGVARLVFASMCEIDGAGDGTVDESSPPHPASLYARSKLAAERLLLDRPDRRTASVVLRLADAYGVPLSPALRSGGECGGRPTPLCWVAPRLVATGGGRSCMWMMPPVPVQAVEPRLSGWPIGFSMSARMRRRQVRELARTCGRRCRRPRCGSPRISLASAAVATRCARWWVSSRSAALPRGSPSCCSVSMGRSGAGGIRITITERIWSG
ncbi:MAG: NAD(P)-dependent oxidoreductase [Thermomicrobiales bacterium]